MIKINSVFTFLALCLSNIVYAEINYEYTINLCINDKKCGRIDLNGNWLIKPKYDKTWFINSQISIVEKNKMHGLLDKNEKNITPFKYELINIPNKNGLMIFQENQKRGIIDSKGKIIIPPTYDQLNINTISQFIFFEKNNTFGMMDFSEKILKTFPYELELLDDTYIRITPNGKKGVIDPYGNEIYAPHAKELTNFFQSPTHQYLSIITTDSGSGVITSEAKIIIQTVYDKLDIYDTNQFIGRQNQIWTMIDLNNNTRFLANADFLDFSYGTDIGIIRKDGLYGYIDLSGKPVSPMKFQFATPFSENNPYALVQLNNKVMAVNREGVLINLNEELNSANLIQSSTNANGSMILNMDRLYGFVSLNTLNWIIPPKYYYVQESVLDIDKKITVYEALIKPNYNFDLYDGNLNKIASSQKDDCGNIVVKNGANQITYEEKSNQLFCQ